MARAIVSAERVAVPLKTRCSMRWEMPAALLGLHARAGVHPDPHRHRPDVRHRLGDEADAVREDALAVAFRHYEASERNDLELLLFRQRGLIAQRGLPRQAHLAVAVDLDDLDHHDVALGEDVADGADAVLGDLRDVQQPLRARDHLDEGAELLDALHLAHVDAVQLHLAADVLDHPQRGLGGVVAGGEDGHLAVVLHVDLGAGLLLDAADDLAAGADDLADLLRPDLDGDEARRVGREARPGAP